MRLFFVLGPTASGKSAYALQLAQDLKGAIVNCDSLQVYKSLDIGTAKPSLEERSICPHFLFDRVDEGGKLTAGEYRRLALEVIEAQLPKQPLVFVGGSGFYVKALTHGMFPVSEVTPEVQEKVQALMKARGLSGAYKELVQRDPEYAAQISSNDSYRVERALGLVLTHGKTRQAIEDEFKKQKESQRLPYAYKKIGLFPDRSVLRQRIQERTLKMLERGWVEEVKGLRERGWKSWPPMQSVGYKEVQAYLDGQLPRESLVEEIVKSTMRLAKRQMTWFKKDPEIEVIEVNS